MATCYNDNVLYIGLPRCGSTSIGGTRHDDGTVTGGYLNDTIPGMSARGLRTGHEALADVLALLGRPADSFKLILASIRDPYEQRASQFAFLRKRCGRHKAEGTAYKDHYAGDLLAMQSTFPDWLANEAAIGANLFCGDKWRQFGDVYRWWLEINGQLENIPNLRVFRLEDAETVLPELTKPFRTRSVEIPKHNASGATPEYMSHYTARGKQIVEEQFRWAFLQYYRTRPLHELRGQTSGKKILATSGG